MKLKTGDKVVVISGANKGKEGKITKVLDDKVIGYLDYSLIYDRMEIDNFNVLEE